MLDFIQKKDTAIWTIISIILCVFSPIGIALVICRCILERRLHEYGKSIIIGPVVGITGWAVFEGILMLCVVNYSSKSGKGMGFEVTSFMIMFFTVIPIIGATIIALTRKKYILLDEQSDLCMTLIEKGYLTDTGEIAEYMNASIEKAEQVIASMIESRMLRGFILDSQQHLLKNTSPYRYVRYKCKFCGADQQFLRNQFITCQYCGNPIEL